MAGQIVIKKVGVPREKDAGIPLDTVTSADPAAPSNPKLNVSSASAMSSNNMPQGRRV